MPYWTAMHMKNKEVLFVSTLRSGASTNFIILLKEYRKFLKVAMCYKYWIPSWLPDWSIHMPMPVPTSVSAFQQRPPLRFSQGVHFRWGGKDMTLPFCGACAWVSCHAHDRVSQLWTAHGSHLGPPRMVDREDGVPIPQNYPSNLVSTSQSGDG